MKDYLDRKRFMREIYRISGETRHQFLPNMATKYYDFKKEVTDHMMKHLKRGKSDG